MGKLGAVDSFRYTLVGQGTGLDRVDCDLLRVQGVLDRVITMNGKVTWIQKVWDRYICLLNKRYDD